MNKDSNTKFSFAHNYTLSIKKDDTVYLKVETEDDILEFDGREGNLMVASDFESHFDEEEIEMPLNKMVEYGTEFLTEWGVEQEVAEAIIKDLTPWFERYALSDEDATLKEIKRLETWVDCKLKCIDERAGWIKEEEEQIAKRIEESSRRINQRREEIAEFQAEMHDLVKQIAELKATLK